YLSCPSVEVYRGDRPWARRAPFFAGEGPVPSFFVGDADRRTVFDFAGEGPVSSFCYTIWRRDVAATHRRQRPEGGHKARPCEGFNAHGEYNRDPEAYSPRHHTVFTGPAAFRQWPSVRLLRVVESGQPDAPEALFPAVRLPRCFSGSICHG